jgi:Spy/CpxP family protein refolding chaperone
MTTTILLLAAALLALPLVAADDDKAPRRPNDGARRTQAGFGGPLSSTVSFEQVLTPEQRQKLREYTQANGEKARASQQQAVQMRRELQEAVLSGQASEATIKEKTESIAKLESEVFAARLNAMAKVAATFTPEQKEKIKELGEQMRAGRSGLGAGPREGSPPSAPREPAAPPPAK